LEKQVFLKLVQISLIGLDCVNAGPFFKFKNSRNAVIIGLTYEKEPSNTRQLFFIWNGYNNPIEIFQKAIPEN
jgi:hypothetical protein